MRAQDRLHALHGDISRVREGERARVVPDEFTTERSLESRNAAGDGGDLEVEHFGGGRDGARFGEREKVAPCGEIVGFGHACFSLALKSTVCVFILPNRQNDFAHYAVVCDS